jgi:hypothetical protein
MKDIAWIDPNLRSNNSDECPESGVQRNFSDQSALSNQVEAVGHRNKNVSNANMLRGRSNEPLIYE